MLSVKELARELGVSAKTVYALVERGEIPHYRIGVGRGTLRFDFEEVKRRLKMHVRPNPIVPIEPSSQKHLL